MSTLTTHTVCCFYWIHFSFCRELPHIEFFLNSLCFQNCRSGRLCSAQMTDYSCHTTQSQSPLLNGVLRICDSQINRPQAELLPPFHFLHSSLLPRILSVFTPRRHMTDRWLNPSNCSRSTLVQLTKRLLFKMKLDVLLQNLETQKAIIDLEELHFYLICTQMWSYRWPALEVNVPRVHKCIFSQSRGPLNATVDQCEQT